MVHGRPWEHRRKVERSQIMMTIVLENTLNLDGRISVKTEKF